MELSTRKHHAKINATLGCFDRRTGLGHEGDAGGVKGGLTRKFDAVTAGDDDFQAGLYQIVRRRGLACRR
jgi:hypothetical protein